MQNKPGFKLRLYQQTEPARSAKGSLSASYAELTSMSQLIALEPSLIDQFSEYSGGYPAIFGSIKLRESIAAYLGVEPQDIIVTNGVDDAIPSIYEALLEPGDKVSLLAPTYDPLPNRARNSSLDVVTAELTLEAKGWVLKKDALRELLNTGVDACVLNVPHNPTGWYPNPEERTSILNQSIEANAYVITDEVYSGLQQSVDSEAKSFASLSDRFISVGSMTKAFGLPGIRIGWIASTDPEVIKKIKNVRTFGHCYISAVSEIVAVTAFKNVDKILHQKKKIARVNLDCLSNFIKKFPAFSMAAPQHGTVCLANFDASMSRFDTAADMCQQLLETRKLILLDNTFFDDKNDWVRFGFGTVKFAELLSEFGSFLEV